MTSDTVTNAQASLCKCVFSTAQTSLKSPFESVHGILVLIALSSDYMYMAHASQHSEGYGESVHLHRLA